MATGRPHLAEVSDGGGRRVIRLVVFVFALRTREVPCLGLAQSSEFRVYSSNQKAVLPGTRWTSVVVPVPFSPSIVNTTRHVYYHLTIYLYRQRNAAMLAGPLTPRRDTNARCAAMMIRPCTPRDSARSALLTQHVSVAQFFGPLPPVGDRASRGRRKRARFTHRLQERHDGRPPRRGWRGPRRHARHRARRAGAEAASRREGRPSAAQGRV